MLLHLKNYLKINLSLCFTLFDYCIATSVFSYEFLIVKYAGAFELITDETKAGACLWISKRRGLEYWPTPAEEAKYRVRPLTQRRKSSLMFPFSIQIPPSFEKM